MIQTRVELEEWYEKEDPWDYESDADDIKRRDILLENLPDRKYINVLDIGCGHGYITRELPGKNITGIDLSVRAIKQANKLGKKRGKNINYIAADFFDLNKILRNKKFDLIIITGVLYPQYIGNAKTLSTIIVDDLLKKGGVLLSVHINEWNPTQFPYLKLAQEYYDYRGFTHDLQVYIK